MVTRRQLTFSLLAVPAASGVLAVFIGNPEFVGSQALMIRAAILDSAILLFLIAIYPLAPVFVKRPETYGFAVCLPALLLRFCILFGCYRGKVRGKYRETS